MKLNIKLLLCLTVITPKLLADGVSWVSQVDSIITGLDDLGSQLANDITLYNNLKQSLNISLEILTQVDTERQKLIQLIHDKIKELNDLIAQQQADNQAQLAQKDAIIAQLNQDLADLRTQAEGEIAALNQLVVQLNSDLTSAKKAYEDLITADLQKTPEVISKLAAARDNYVQMVAARTAFLEELDKLAAAVNTHVASEQADIEEMTATLECPDNNCGSY